MDLLDSTITQVAAPTIRRELGGSYAVIEWVTAAYALAMAAGLLTGGRLGDMFGRRRVLLTGMALFVAASAACAAAGSAGELIAARAAQGAAGRDHAAAGVRADLGPVRAARDGPGVRRLRAGDGPVGHARADRGGRADRRRPVRRRLADDLPGQRARSGSPRWCSGARFLPAGSLAAVAGTAAGGDGWTCRARSLAGVAMFGLVFPLAQGHALGLAGLAVRHARPRRSLLAGRLRRLPGPPSARGPHAARRAVRLPARCVPRRPGVLDRVRRLAGRHRDDLQRVPAERARLHARGTRP